MTAVDSFEETPQDPGDRATVEQRMMEGPDKPPCFWPKNYPPRHLVRREQGAEPVSF